MAKFRFSKLPGEKRKTQRLNEMAFAFKSSGILVAALELGLFTRMSEGAQTLTQIARSLDMPTDATDRLLTGCLALELIEKKGASHYNAPDVEKYLVRGRPTYFGDYLAHTVKSQYDGWKNLASALKPAGAYYRIRDDARAARDLTVAGYESSISAGHVLAKSYDFSRYSLLLDLGGGSGCYSIAAAMRHPNLRAIVFDFPTVCAVTEEFIAKAGLSDRIKTYPGDFMEDDYPRGADVMLICGNLQAYSGRETQKVIKKAFNALKPGGGIIVIDYMLDDDRTGPLDPAYQHVGAAFSQGRGRVKSATEFIRYLKRAGFVDMAASEFIPSQMGKVTARKSA